MCKSILLVNLSLQPGVVFVILYRDSSIVPRFAIEGNLTYQYDVHYNTENLYALNLILLVYFESKKVKKSENEI